MYGGEIALVPNWGFLCVVSMNEGRSGYQKGRDGKCIREYQELMNCHGEK